MCDNYEYDVVMKKGYVYIISNKNRTTFYTGVTSTLKERVEKHRKGIQSNFPSRYNLKDLVYYEELGSMLDAIYREKQIKRWHRKWKIHLIKGLNPEMKDLFNEL